MMFRYIVPLLLLANQRAGAAPPATNASSVPGFNVSVVPEDRIYLVIDGSFRNLTITLPPSAVSGHQRVHLGVHGGDLIVDGLPTVVNITRQAGVDYELSVELRGVRMGRGTLTLALDEELPEVDATPHVYEGDVGGYEVLVIRGAMSRFALICLLLLAFGMSLNIFAASCSLELSVILHHLRHPTSLLVGYLCQFVITPVVAYLLGLAFSLSAVMHYGLLLLGVGPGAGSSNFITTALGGDLDLSVIMTFSSSLLSVVLIPLWMTTLGETILHGEFPTWSIRIPWLWLLGFALAFSVPTLFGVLLNRFSRRVSRIVGIIARITALVITHVTLAFVIYNNVWIYEYMDDWRTVVATSINSHLSYIISFALAYAVSRRDMRLTVTITVEAGIQGLQSSTIALMMTAPAPESQIGYIIIGVYFYHMVGTAIIAMIANAIIQMLRRRLNGDGMSYSISDEFDNSKVDIAPAADVSKLSSNTNSTSNVVVAFPQTAGKFELTDKY